MTRKAPHKKSNPVKRSKMGQGKRLPRGLRKYFRRFPERRPHGSKVGDAFPPTITVSKPTQNLIDFHSLRTATNSAPYHDCPYCGNYSENVVRFIQTNFGHINLVTCWKCGRKYKPY